MREFFSQYLGVTLVLIALAIALTLFVFRKQLFDRGWRKGEAVDPAKVRRENPPDEWSRSH
jgi:hypothetical protein